MKKRNDISVYILAGGKSSRMGSDKGLMLLNGKPMVQCVLDIANPLFEKVTIVSSNLNYARFGLELISDRIQNCGPAAGIEAALNHCESSKILVLSCDMPFVTSKAINYLINQSNESQITVPYFRNKLEPMIAVYDKTCWKKWHETLRQGVYKLQDLIDQFQCKKIISDNLEEFNSQIFTNINTEEEFRNALIQMGNDN